MTNHELIELIVKSAKAVDEAFEQNGVYDYIRNEKNKEPVNP